MSFIRSQLITRVRWSRSGILNHWIRNTTINCLSTASTPQYIKPTIRSFHTTASTYQSSSSTTLFTHPYNTLLVSESTAPCNYITVTINRENVHNAFNAEVIDEMTSVFTAIHNLYKSNQLAARAVVLTGSGTKSFSSGADLNWMKSMKQYTYERNKQDSEYMFNMFHCISTCPIPTISRINGSALGGGTGLAAVADMNVAVDNAIFGLTEVRLGLAPAVISKWVINKIGSSNSSYYWLTGNRFTAAQGKSIGLIQHVVNDINEMDQYIVDILQSISSSSPQAVYETKKLIQYVSAQSDYESCRNYCTDLIAQLRVSDQGQEGLNAFLEKRKPSWTTAK